MKGKKHAARVARKLRREYRLDFILSLKVARIAVKESRTGMSRLADYEKLGFHVEELWETRQFHGGLHNIPTGGFELWGYDAKINVDNLRFHARSTAVRCGCGH